MKSKRICLGLGLTGSKRDHTCDLGQFLGASYARAWMGLAVMKKGERKRLPKTDPKIFLCRRNNGRLYINFNNLNLAVDINEQI